MTAVQEVPLALPSHPAPAEKMRPRGLTVNYLLLTSGELTAKALGFAGFVYLGRVLGAEAYGQLELVLAAMVFFTLLVDFGLPTYGAREVARHPERAARLLGEIATLRLLLACISFSGVALLAVLLPESQDAKSLLLLYGLTLFAVPSLLQWFFQGHDRMQWVAATSVLRQGTFTVLLLLVIRPGTALPWIGACECGAVLLAAGFNLIVTARHMKGSLPRLRLDARTLGDHFRHAAPIGLSELAWAFLWYSPTVLLGLIAGGDPVGWFGASHRVVMALHAFVWLYFYNMLPTLARLSALPLDQLRGFLDRSLAATGWAGSLVALGLSVLGGELLNLAYGPAFAGAGRLLMVLAWILPVVLWSGHYRYTLIACNLARLEFLCSLGGAVVGLGLGLLLIPGHGAPGAATALLIANLVHGTLAFVVVQRRIGSLPLSPQLALPMVVAAACIALSAALDWLGPWASGAVSVGVFVAALLLANPQRSRN